MSKLLNLNWQDLVKGLVVVVLAVVLGAVKDSLTNCGIEVSCFDWASILDMALTAGGAYLAKNLFTDSNGKLGGVL
jgi:hypothetical protein